MNHNTEHLVMEYTKLNNLIFYFLFDAAGNVLEHNAFASQFIKNGVPVRHMKEVFVDFHDRINYQELALIPEKEHVFSINSHSGIPESFYFSFLKDGEDYLALGRLDVLELETFHVKLIELNNEVSNISRDLHKSNAELKKMNELKNYFLGMAVHDLRKPISVIKGYVSLILNGAAKAPGRLEEFLRSIDNSVLGMESLVNNFLDVSVIESGKLKLVMTEFGIKESINEMLVLNRMKAENRKINLIIDTGDKDIIIKADKAKLQQVLDNITGNAIEYTPNGGTVTVNVREQNGMAEFSVEDEGPGLPENAREKLFKPFGKTGVVKASGEKSTGLGLLISKKIVEEHGGAIGAGNREGKGARFWFTVPQIQAGGQQ